MSMMANILATIQLTSSHVRRLFAGHRSGGITNLDALCGQVFRRLHCLELNWIDRRRVILAECSRLDAQIADLDAQEHAKQAAKKSKASSSSFEQDPSQPFIDPAPVHARKVASRFLSAITSISPSHYWLASIGQTSIGGRKSFSSLHMCRRSEQCSCSHACSGYRARRSVSCGCFS